MQPPLISRPYAWAAGILLFAFALGMLVPFVLMVVSPYLKSGQPSADWTPLRMLGALAFMVGLVAFLGFAAYQRFATVLSAEGVSFPALRGRKMLPWKEIRRVGVRGTELLLEGPSGTLIVNTVCFADAAEDAAYVRSQLERVSPGGRDAR